MFGIMMTMDNFIDDEQLGLEDLFLWAEDILGIPASRIALSTRISQASSALAAPFAGVVDQLFYPDPATRGAILCSRLVRNHPFVDGNKRIALMAMIDQMERAGLEWVEPVGGQEEIAGVVEDLAARILSEADFIEWVKRHTRPLA